MQKKLAKSLENVILTISGLDTAPFRRQIKIDVFLYAKERVQTLINVWKGNK